MALAASDIGDKPSIKMATIRGIKIKTAAVVMPKFKIFVKSYCAKPPMIIPIINPITAESPKIPNFF